MPFDPRIPLQAFPDNEFDPFKNKYKLEQLAGLRSDNEYRNLQIQEARMRLADLQAQHDQQTQIQNAARAAVVPQQGSYQDPGMQIGGMELPGRTVNVQGPAQFSPNQFASSLDQIDPMAAQGYRAQQAQAQQESQKAQIAQQESLTKLHSSQLDLAGKQLEYSGRALQMAKSSPDPVGTYPKVRQHLIDTGVAHESQLPAQIQSPQDLDALINQGLTLEQQVQAEQARRTQQQQQNNQNAQLSSKTAEIGGNVMQFNPQTLTYDKKLGPVPVKPAGPGSGSGQNDIEDTADAIVAGQASPRITDYSFRDRTKIQAALHRRGYDDAKAALDWNATNRYVSTLNGPQQVRLRQSIEAAGEMTDKIDGLYQEWKSIAPTTGFSALNKASLLAMKNLPGRPGAVARALEAQIADLTADLGNIYMGGNSPTDQALRLGGKSISADWNDETFKEAIKQIKANVNIRRNSINLGSPSGIQGGGYYKPNDTPQGGGEPQVRKYNPTTGRLE